MKGSQDKVNIFLILVLLTCRLKNAILLLHFRHPLSQNKRKPQTNPLSFSAGFKSETQILMSVFDICFIF